VIELSLKLKVTWLSHRIQSRLAIIGEETKERLKGHNLILLRNPNKDKSTVVRTVSIDDVFFPINEEMLDFIRSLESNEYILLSRMLENVLGAAKDDWITLKFPETNLFTYGTFLSAFWDFTNSEHPFLMLPGSRHYVLEEHHFMRAKLDRFVRIWPPGLSFPFIIPQESAKVIGEIYFDLPKSKFIELDRIEGEGYLYHRENVCVELLDVPFKGLKVDAVTYVGAPNLISEQPKEPIFDHLTFGDVYYIEREEYAYQQHSVNEEFFIKYLNGTIPILITTYSPALEAQYREESSGNLFKTSLDELSKLVDEITREIFLQSDEKQLPYFLVETLQNIWSPKIQDSYNEKKDPKRYIETTCNSFIEKIQKFIKECVERFGQCILLILKSHLQEGIDLIVEYHNEVLDLDLLIKNLKSTYQLTYSTDKDKIIEDLLIQSNIEKIAVIQIKIQEEILLNPFKRKNLAAELAEILLMF